MKKILWYVFALSLSMVTTLYAESEVGFSADSIQTRVGQTFTANIVITGFPVTEGGGISLMFNPNVLQVLSITVNSTVWDFVSQQGVIDNANGVVSDILFSSYSEVTGNATVATVSFRAQAQGKSTLTIMESKINPFASSGERITPSFLSSNINVKKVNRGGCYGECHR